MRIENEYLRQQIKVAKQQLIDLESRNGKKQIAVPNQNTSATSAKATAVQASQKPAAATEKQTAKQPKVEKKPKTENPASTAAASDEAPVDIGRIDLRIGKIVEVQKHPDADSLYLEKIDLGEEKPRQIVSGLVKWHTLEEMQNRLVVVFCNLKPAKMRGILSEGMVLCASTPEKVELMTPPPDSVPGDLVHCEGYNRNPDALLNPKKKIWESIAPDLKTNDNLIGCYKGAPLHIPGKGQIKATIPSLKGAHVK